MNARGTSWSAAVGVVGFAAAFAACASDPTPPPEAPAPPGVVVPFRPAAAGPPRFGDVPFPSDLFLEKPGQVADIAGLERLVEKTDAVRRGLRELDGFGRSTGAIFFVDQPVDPSTLPATWGDAQAPSASVLLVDVDPTSARRGTRYPAVARYLPSLGCISAIPFPGVVLPPGVRHAAALTGRARAASGAPLVADEALARIAAGDRASQAGALYGEALDSLVTTGAVGAASEVAALAVFTTSRRAFELPALRDRLRALPPPALQLDPAQAAPYSAVIFGVQTAPTLDQWLGSPEKDDAGREWPGGDNPGGIAHDAIGAVASGAFVAPSLLDPATHRFERGADGAYAVADANLRIPVTLVIPKEPPPPGGYPVVIHGHGLSNNRGSMLSMANELARAGFAVVGIDDVLHGARGGFPDEKNNYPGAHTGPDGIPDAVTFPVEFFANFTDFVSMRDNFRQTVLDQTSLVRLIQSEQLDLSPMAAACGFVPRLDPQRISWSGGSLGGIMGTMTVAVEPEIHAAALQVPGAGFIQFITTGSAKIAPLVGLVARGNFGMQGDEPLDEFHPLGLLLAAATEAGDPIAYAPHILREPLAGRAPPDLLITYAVGDEVLPNLSTAALIRALGVPQVGVEQADFPGVQPIAGPASRNLGDRTAAAVAYGPANHGLGYVRRDLREYLPGVPFASGWRFPKLAKSFLIEMPIREHCDQLATFLRTAREGSARVEITAPARADFDGDGALDDVDPDPLDPAIH